jgi:hypothetical protein
MSATQVSAGIALLKKVMPDLASIEHSGSLNVNAAEIGDQELAAIASGGRARITAAEIPSKVTH